MQKLPTLPQADSCRTRLCTHHPPLTCGALIPHWMVSHWKLQFINPAHRVTMKSNNIMTVTHIAQMQTNSAMQTLSLVILIFITLCVCVTHVAQHTGEDQRATFRAKSLNLPCQFWALNSAWQVGCKCFYLLSHLVSHWVIKNDQLPIKERKRYAPRGNE